MEGDNPMTVPIPPLNLSLSGGDAMASGEASGGSSGSTGDFTFKMGRKPTITETIIQFLPFLIVGGVAWAALRK